MGSTPFFLSFFFLFFLLSHCIAALRFGRGLRIVGCVFAFRCCFITVLTAQRFVSAAGAIVRTERSFHRALFDCMPRAFEALYCRVPGNDDGHGSILILYLFKAH